MKTPRIGSVVYATEQGLGYLAKSFYDAGVIDRVLIYRHHKYHNHTEWYPPDTPNLITRPFKGPDVDKFLSEIDVCLFFETPFDWNFPDLCRQHGVRTVMIPMYEWFPVNPSHRFDKFICPSLLDCTYFLGSPFLQIPVDPSTWKPRVFAQRFLHNSGHIGFRRHKGTFELLKAIPHLSPDIDLTIRSQEPQEFYQLVKEAQIEPAKYPNVKFEVGNFPKEHLFDGYDVLVAPEKFNGMSFPLQEAFAAGLLVITTNRFPMNTWLPVNPMVSVYKTQRARVSGPYNEFDECIIDPKEIARVINEWQGRNISLYSCQGYHWAQSNSWEKLKPQFIREITT